MAALLVLAVVRPTFRLITQNLCNILQQISRGVFSALSPHIETGLDCKATSELRARWLHRRRPASHQTDPACRVPEVHVPRQAWPAEQPGGPVSNSHSEAQRGTSILASRVIRICDDNLPLSGLCFCGICSSQPCQGLRQSSVDILAGACDFQS